MSRYGRIKHTNGFPQCDMFYNRTDQSGLSSLYHGHLSPSKISNFAIPIGSQMSLISCNIQNNWTRLTQRQCECGCTFGLTMNLYELIITQQEVVEMLWWVCWEAVQELSASCVFFCALLKWSENQTQPAQTGTVSVRFQCDET